MKPVSRPTRPRRPCTATVLAWPPKRRSARTASPRGGVRSRRRRSGRTRRFRSPRPASAARPDHRQGRDRTPADRDRGHLPAGEAVGSRPPNAAASPASNATRAPSAASSTPPAGASTMAMPETRSRIPMVTDSSATPERRSTARPARRDGRSRRASAPRTRRRARSARRPCVGTRYHSGTRQPAAAGSANAACRRSSQGRSSSSAGPC